MLSSCRQVLSARCKHSILFRSLSSNTEPKLLKTALHDLHVSLGGKMVEFAGYSMPVQYKDVGIVKSHLHTRESASLFDVSHMGQLKLFGKDRVRFLERVVVGDIAGLSSGQARLTLLTNSNGGIIDDCVVTAYDDHLYVVVNAGNKQADLLHLHEQLSDFSGDVFLEDASTERSLIAIQGPKAVATVTSMFSNNIITSMPFMSGLTSVSLGSYKDVIVTRCGYTGEDGLELNVPSTDVENLTTELLQNSNVLPAGLGARDSLRLEAGLCLHGHDITPTTTPVEAALAWTIGKRRRESADFIGADVILRQLKEKSNTSKRVGFVMPAGCPPAREEAVIYNSDNEEIGTVTSGTLSPCLKHPIGMAYIKRGFFKIGTQLQVQVRKKRFDFQVAKMPFVPTNYYV